MTFDEKLALYNDYFTLNYQVQINLIPLGEQERVPDDLNFLQEMPYPFRLASELNEIDAKALRPLRHLGHQADQLVEFLNLQSRKIDLVMSYILSMENDSEHRYQTDEFGAGGFIAALPEEYQVGQQARLKLFLTDMATAIYCYGEVLEVAKQKDGELFITKLVYNQIREEDREILIRAALHEQSRQLKLLSEQRKQST